MPHWQPPARLIQVPGESIGWTQLVATVDHAYRALPPARRDRAVIFAADYGEAGAIHVYVCTRPREPWPEIWPRLRHYD